MDRGAEPLGRSDFLSGRISNQKAISPRKGCEGFLGWPPEKHSGRIMAAGDREEIRADARRSIREILRVFTGAASLIPQIRGACAAILENGTGHAASPFRSYDCPGPRSA